MIQHCLINDAHIGISYVALAVAGSQALPPHMDPFKVYYLASFTAQLVTLTHNQCWGVSVSVFSC